MIKSTRVQNKISPEREKRVMLHRAALFRCIMLLFTHYHRFLRIVKVNSISFLIILFIKLLSYNYIITSGSYNIWVLISARWSFSFRWKNCLVSLVWACFFCASTAVSLVRLNVPWNLFIIGEIIYRYSILGLIKVISTIQ